jgi:hypothetical protein
MSKYDFMAGMYVKVGKMPAGDKLVHLSMLFDTSLTYVNGNVVLYLKEDNVISKEEYINHTFKSTQELRDFLIDVGIKYMEIPLLKDETVFIPIEMLKKASIISVKNLEGKYYTTVVNNDMYLHRRIQHYGFNSDINGGAQVVYEECRKFYDRLAIELERYCNELTNNKR